MGRRLSRGGVWTSLVGLLAVAGALGRMGSLIEPRPEGLAWQWILIGAFVLGVAIAVVGRAFRLNAFAVAAGGIVVVTVLLGRVVSAETMWATVVPTRDTVEAIAASLATGLEYLQYSNAPMFPHQEFILLLVPIFVAIGLAWAWLAAGGNGAAAAVVPAGLYLGVAIADQEPSSLWWLLASVLWVGAVLIVSGLEETASLPRLLGKPGRRGALVAGSTVVVLALVITYVGGDSVPGGGAMSWQAGGFGVGTGTSLNPYASIVQDNLVSNSEEVVFSAFVSPAALADDFYWRLLTLDTYDGTRWGTSTRGASDFRDVDDLESPDQSFRLGTTTVTANVVIDTLRQRQLPLPVGVESVTTNALTILDGGHVTPDGSLFLDRPTYSNLRYSLQADVPSASLGEIALAGGSLSPLFAAAQEQGDLAVTGSASADLSRPSDLDRYLGLPDEVDDRVRSLAVAVTQGATTDLERMVILEEYFRDDGRFTYTTDIQDGHGAESLSAWLTEADSPNYQRGYCEQFATAMGVMGRVLGVPTRLVLGFTPGEVLDEDGLVAVRGSNAHSWVEAWIDGAGWVSFDPTPRGEGDNPSTSSALPLDPSTYIPENPLGDFPDAAPIVFNAEGVPETGGLPEGLEEDVPTPDFLPDDVSEIPEDGAPFAIPSWAWWTLALLVAVAAVPTAKWLRRRRRLALARQGDVSAAWDEITDRLRDLDRTVDRGMTPTEIAEANLPELVPLAAAHSQAEWSESGPGQLATQRAMQAFDDAEDTLAHTTPLVRKLAAIWRPRSLRRP